MKLFSMPALKFKTRLASFLAVFGTNLNRFQTQLCRFVHREDYAPLQCS